MKQKEIEGHLDMQAYLAGSSLILLPMLSTHFWCGVLGSSTFDAHGGGCWLVSSRRIYLTCMHAFSSIPFVFEQVSNPSASRSFDDVHIHTYCRPRRRTACAFPIIHAHTHTHTRCCGHSSCPIPSFMYGTIRFSKTPQTNR